jgi:hypothetical protein
MKYIVAALALLAILKIYAQDQIYRSATADALISAYRDRAIAACQKYDAKIGAGSAADAWSHPSSIALQIGRDDLGVNVWEISDARWDAAYKQPYLVLSASGPSSPVTCTYEVKVDVASVKRE